MKNLLFLLMFCPLLSFAQVNDSLTRDLQSQMLNVQRSMDKSGKALQGFQRTMQAGLAMEVVGGCLWGFGVVQAADGVAIAGTALAVIGLITTMVGYTQAGKAGWHLRNNGIFIDLAPAKK